MFFCGTLKICFIIVIHIIKNPGCTGQQYQQCVPSYLLIQYGKIGNESKDTPVSHGHWDISVTMNVYTNIGFDDAEEELKRMEEFRKAKAEIEKKNGMKNRCRRRCLKQFNKEDR